MQRYDFRQPSGAPASPSDSLNALHAAFASAFADALRAALGAPIDVAATTTDVMRYEEFVDFRASPTCLSILRVDPCGAQICLDLSPQIAFPLIDRLLGGRGAVAQNQRPLTQTEQGVMLQIIERAAAALADTWRDRGIESVCEEALLSDPTGARIMPQDEMVSVVNFHVGFMGDAGSMSLCLPAPVMNVLSGTPATTAPTPAQRQRDSENLTANVMQSAIELRALLAETKLRLSAVLDLQKGDVITTDIPAGDRVSLCLRDQTLLRGRVVELQGKLAIEIAKPAGGQHNA